MSTYIEDFEDDSDFKTPIPNHFALAVAGLGPLTQDMRDNAVTIRDKIWLGDAMGKSITFYDTVTLWFNADGVILGINHYVDGHDVS